MTVMVSVASTRTVGLWHSTVNSSTTTTTVLVKTGKGFLTFLVEWWTGTFLEEGFLVMVFLVVFFVEVGFAVTFLVLDTGVGFLEDVCGAGTGAFFTDEWGTTTSSHPSSMSPGTAAAFAKVTVAKAASRNLA